MVAVVCSFQSELRVMEEKMKDEIRFKSFQLEDLIDLQLNKLDLFLCPAVALAVSSMKGQSGERMINLASVFQYVFLANKIHNLVTDGDLTESERQYPVLVGDYMLGQIFLKICRDDFFSYAGQFVKVIETMNEGILLRWRFKNKNITLKDYRSILGKERASLTALAAGLSAEISGCKNPVIKKVEELGYCLGMAWAAWEEQVYTVLVQEYLAKAKATIAELREHCHIRPLQELFDFLYQEVSPKVALAGIK